MQRRGPVEIAVARSLGGGGGRGFGAAAGGGGGGGPRECVGVEGLLGVCGCVWVLWMWVEW